MASGQETPAGTWRRRNVATVGYVAAWGGLHVTGKIAERHCGCRGEVGVRMDNREFTFLGTPCDIHDAQVERTLDTLKHMPPQDRPVLDLFVERLDAEIGHA